MIIPAGCISQVLRLSDCQIHLDSWSLAGSPRIAKTRELSDCVFFKTSKYQTFRLSDTQTLRPSGSKHSDPQILRLSDTQTPCFLGSQILRLSESLSDFQILRL